METKRIEFQYRDRDLNRIEVSLHDSRDFEESWYALTANFSSGSFYGNVIFAFSSRILDFYPNYKEARRDSIFELCTLLAKWLIVTGQYRNFETIERAEYPRLRLRAVDRQGKADYVYRDEERKITLVHPFIHRFDIEEHQLTRLAIAESLYRVALNENDLYKDASMPKPLVIAELAGLIDSKYVTAKIKEGSMGVAPSADLRLTLTGRNFYERTVQKRSRIVFIIAACEAEDKPLQKEIIDTYKEAIRTPAGLEPIFQEHEEPHKNIYVDIFDYIDASEFVVADITYQRASCYIEIGYALAKQKQVLLFVEEDYFNDPNKMNGKVPFDLFATKYQTYKRTDLADLKKKCDERIKTVQSRQVS
jgi:nucleoside 2-deoxyribosyltransferase